jgi:2-methylcitrate dehydratase PrpD
MEMTTNAELTQRAPGSYPCLLEASGTDGREYRAEVLYPPGFSRGSLERKAVVAKFHALTETRVSRAVRDRIIDAAFALDKLPSLDPLMTALVTTG